MENERLENYKTFNTCATIGFLLTLLNIVISVALIITGNMVTFLIFASVTALVSLALCIVGVSNANRAGKGKVLSILGIIFSILILLAVVFFIFGIILFAQACAGLLQGVILG